MSPELLAYLRTLDPGLDPESLRPSRVYGIVLMAARAVCDSPNEDIRTLALLRKIYPYDESVWLSVDSQPAPPTSVKNWCLYRRCYSPITRVVRWSRGAWRAVDPPYAKVTPLPGDLWRPMSNQEMKEWNA